MIRYPLRRRARGHKYEYQSGNLARKATALLTASVVMLLAACEQPDFPLNDSEPGKPSQYISYLKAGQKADGVLVKFSASTGAASRARSLNAAGLTARADDFRLVPGLTLTTTNAGLSINETLSNLAADPTVAYAEPDYIVEASAIPNDSMFSQQWGLDQANDNDIDAPEAWDVTTGNANVIVAIIDSGVDWSHPDLQSQIWTNPGEIANNNRDDDGNGFVDDVRGWDFGADDNDPMDENDHGTHVAGVIGAQSNNNRGVAGLNWNIQIMPLKFMNAAGQGSTSAAIRSLDYAVANGARISNNSWGGGNFSQALFDAIQNANAQNHLFVAAAGNDGINTDNTASYPSGYNLPNIISVAATDQNDQLTGFSNFGRQSVDLAAPGTQIFSSVRNGSYRAFSGTSMAAPFVSGVAGLALSQNSGLSVTELKAAILDNVDPVGALAGRVLTGGRLNAFNTVNGTPSTPPTTPVDPVAITQPTSTNLTTGDTVQLVATGGDGNFTWQSSNVTVATVNNSGLLTARNPGSTQISVSDGNGLVSTVVSFTITTPAVNNLTLSPANINQIGVNDTVPINVSGGTAPYTWTSSDNAIATVTRGTTSSQRASIRPNAAGSFRITVTDNTGNTVQTGFITVAATPINIGTSQTVINIAETLQLTVTGGTSPYTWTSSQPGVISVNSGGLIEGISEGSSSIRVQDNQGATASVIIQVINVATGALIVTPDVNIYGVNTRAALKATGGGKSITWSSADPAIAVVNSSGIATAKAVGITQISATDENGVSGFIPFEVRTISITGSTYTIGAGDTLQLVAEGGVGPYQWSSSNTSLATVDNNGLLSSNLGSFGGILVTATDADNISKSLIVTINDATSLRAPRSQ